jgi:hypothetical protein
MEEEKKNAGLDVKPAGEGSEAPGSETTGGDAKRVVKRKPLWLAVPKEYTEFVGEDGEIERSPATYELYECATKKEVSEVLTKLKINASNINPEHVKLFRADPIVLRLSTQITIKF